LILFTLMMESTCSSKTSVRTRAIGHHILEDGIHHSCSKMSVSPSSLQTKKAV
jgi:hypothetical protein